jgi:DNA-binding beta-propeller fold protein YncE
MRRIITLLVCLCALTAGAQTALRLIKTIPLPNVSGRIDHFAFDTRQLRLFMAALGNDTVEVVDSETGKRLKTIRGCSDPQGLGYVAASNRLFVANGGSGELKIYDADTFQCLQTVSSLSDADNVRYDVVADRVWVGFGGGGLAAFNQDGVRAANIPLNSHPESFQLEKRGGRSFVNLPGERSVIVIDRKKLGVMARWRLESAHSNFPMALDELGHRLFIGCRSPARLLVLDTADGRTVAQVEISGDTDDVFFDGKRQRIYVSCGEGFFDVIQRHDGDHYERIAHLPTRVGARTSFYSPETDRLFLALPKRSGQDAEIRVYQPE